MSLPVRVTFGCLLIMAVVACSGGAIPDEAKFSGVAAELWRGPEHCDWDGTHFVLIDEDLPGANVTNMDMPGSHMFVQDPGEVSDYSYDVEADIDRPVPGDAEKLGESDDASLELWYSQSDPHFLYVIGDGFTEAWVRATGWGLCS